MAFPKLTIGDVVARVPIIQGGMGVGVSLSGLASAVANAGGVGVIATAVIGMGEPDLTSNYLEANIRALRREIRRAREMSRGILGVNIMVALSNFADMVRTSVEEGVDVIFSGAGLPVDLPRYLKEGCKTKLVPIVSSARAAKILCKKWISRFKVAPSAFVVEGPLAGGHLGFSPDQILDPAYRLESLIPQVVESVYPFEREVGSKIPIIAAGGIYTGGDIYAFLQLGASGVQMGTRFVATHECDADPGFKKAYLKAKKEDLVIIQSPVGLPGRAIRNRFLEDVLEGKKKPFTCPCHCISTCSYKQSPYCIALALINAKKGKLKHGFAFAGQNAYRVDSIVSVEELISSLLIEYEQACRKASTAQVGDAAVAGA